MTDSRPTELSELANAVNLRRMSERMNFSLWMEVMVFSFAAKKMTETCCVSPRATDSGDPFVLMEQFLKIEAFQFEK